MHLSSLVAKTCQRLQLIFEEDPVNHNHSKYSINSLYPIFVEQPTISSPFVTSSLTMTTNLLPLTLSRPWPPLQLSFEDDPVTHNPSSSFPYFRTWWRNGGVSKIIMTQKADSWEGMCACVLLRFLPPLRKECCPQTSCILLLDGARTIGPLWSRLPEMEGG